MARQEKKRDSYLGGASLLAAAAYLCVKGLQAVEKQLKRKGKK